MQEETEDEVLAAMEEAPSQKLISIHTSSTNEALRESSMQNDPQETSPRPIRTRFFFRNCLNYSKNFQIIVEISRIIKKSVKFDLTFSQVQLFEVWILVWK